MTTVTSNVTLTIPVLLSRTLNISVSKSISSQNTTGLARKPITSTAKGTASGQVTLHTAADFAAPAYLYVKNMDTTSADHVIVYDDTTSGTPLILLLKVGEFAFMPVHNSIDLKAYAVTTSTPVEFVVFGTEA